jgi:ArsR family transcriptional regulator, arsenate/arsenite/antimonite-responsive transcriptional repressor
MRKILAITNALADGSRIRTLLALRRGRLCVTQIADLLQLAPSTVSKHLSILRHADLVDSRKEDRWVYYALSESPDVIVRQALEWILDSAANTPLIIEDSRRLKAILKENPEKLRRRQKA